MSVISRGGVVAAALGFGLGLGGCDSVFGASFPCFQDSFTGTDLSTDWVVLYRDSAAIAIAQDDSLEMRIAKLGETENHFNAVSSFGSFDLEDGYLSWELVTPPGAGTETNFVLIRHGTPDYVLFNLQPTAEGIGAASYVGRESIDYRAFDPSVHRYVRFIHRANEGTIAFEIADAFMTEWVGMQVPAPFPMNELDISMQAHNIGPTTSETTIRWDNVLVKSGSCAADEP